MDEDGSATALDRKIMEAQESLAQAEAVMAQAQALVTQTGCNNADEFLSLFESDSCPAELRRMMQEGWEKVVQELKQGEQDMLLRRSGKRSGGAAGRARRRAGFSRI